MANEKLRGRVFSRFNVIRWAITCVLSLALFVGLILNGFKFGFWSFFFLYAGPALIGMAIALLDRRYHSSCGRRYGSEPGDSDSY